MTRLVPPTSEDLTFIREKKTGTVHVLRHYDEPFDNGGADLMADWGTVARQAILSPGPEMLCRKRLKYGWPQQPGEIEDRFPDEALCPACHKALDRAGQAHRAFAHPVPDDPDEAA